MQQRMEYCYQQLCNLYGQDHVFFVYLYGSQNYDLSSNESDVDTKAVLFLPQEDLILRKSLWTPIPLGDGLCYTTDLLTFLEELTQYVPKALELFITKNVQINPMYEDLFVELMAFKSLFTNRNIYQGVSQFFGLAWEHYRIFTESHRTKELVHAYRNMQCAYDLYMGLSLESCVSCSIKNKDQLKQWKKEIKPPRELVDAFTSLSGTLTLLMDEIGEITNDPILPEIQEFCVKAYKAQQKISLDFSKKI